jgi:hypothetical protein
MTAVAVLIAFLLGFFLGQKDMEKAYFSEMERRDYWFKKYIEVVNKVIGKLEAR